MILTLFGMLAGRLRPGKKEGVDLVTLQQQRIWGNDITEQTGEGKTML
jgi:hypothetical protein